MTQINLFNGGKNTRADPSLLGLNEAVLYSNIDNSAGVLKSAKDYTPTDTIVEGGFYFFKNKWISSTLDRDYLEYKDNLYWTEENSTPKKYDGTTIRNLGIAAPTVKLTTVQSDPVGSEKISTDPVTLQYVYTYYNSVDGTESAPCPISDELSLAANKTVTITGWIAPTDSQVDKFRLYRVGASATTMTLIVELPITTTTYVDSIPTPSAIGTLLDTYNNQQPPVGLKYIILAYGYFFAAVEDKLRYSIVGKPNYWPALNEIDIDGTITGLLPTQDGILIFTTDRMYILIGTIPEQFAIIPVSTEQGCNSHKSCKLVNNRPTWSSNDGICVWQNGAPDVVSRDKLGKITLSIKNTIVYDNTYFICLNDGTVLAMDTRFGLAFKNFSFDKPLVNIGVFNTTLYGMIDGKVVTLFNGNDLTFTWKSGELSEGYSSMTKLYNNIYVRANGEFTFNIYIPEYGLVLTKQLNGNKVFDMQVPEEKQRGSAIQFEVIGKGIIKEIEWKPVGRQNGR